MASSSNTNKAMAAATGAAAVDTSVPLKCPRCDSSNTKFCYYNNYSLSQPRHFCKACKRYWTRGGTLRNVPVGGGCRKNKRHKRHSSSSSASAQAQLDLPLPPPPPSSSTSHIHNPLFYGGPLELSFPFSSFRVSSDDGGGGGFDGLGFSSEGNGYKNGFNLSSPFSSAADNNNNNNSNNNSIFFGSSTMASLLSSTQKFKDFQAQALMPYEEPQMPGAGKQVKAEGENRFPWNPNYPNSNSNPNSNPMDQMNSSDPSSLVWNTSSISTWFDPSTMGSSVPSLI